MSTVPSRQDVPRDYLTIADLIAMPHLGLQLVGGHDAATNPVLWTHVSELSDPGPWLEGGELLIVNGFGIPGDTHGQVEYVARLAHHRLAGLVVSVKAPELSREMLDEADRLSFPVLRVPRHVPFIELSYLVANASERSTRGRLSRHLRIFETLRFRNSAESNVVEIYSQLEQVSGYRLALVSPAGRPLLREWPWMPDDLRLDLASRNSPDLQVIPDGYVLPLFVGERVTAYLVGKEHREAPPGGLAALQHVSTLAALDAIDDQRRREAVHRQGSALLSGALDGGVDAEEVKDRFADAGLDLSRGMRFLAFESAPETTEIEVRDWLADRNLPHLLLNQGHLFAVVSCRDDELRVVAADLGTYVGVSTWSRELGELPRMQRQALWSLNLARELPEGSVVLAEEQLGLGRWLNRDVETMNHLAEGTLYPIMKHDAEHGTDLVRTLAVYFQNQGRLRKAAAQLFVHEHTLTNRLRRIEQLTGRNLKTYRDVFELWLAVEARSAIE